MARHAVPVVAGVVRDIERTGRAAERERLAVGIDVEGMAIDQVIRVLLRQTAGQCVEAVPSVTRSIDHHAPAARNAALVLVRRHEPRDIGVPRMHRDRESERGRLDVLQFAPVAATVRGAEDAVVMLRPQDFGRCRAVRDAVYVLDAGIAGPSICQSRSGEMVKRPLRVAISSLRRVVTDSTSTECLHHEDLAVRVNRIGEAIAVLRGGTIDEDHHMLAQPALVIEQIAREPGMVRETRNPAPPGPSRPPPWPAGTRRGAGGWA